MRAMVVSSNNDHTGGSKLVYVLFAMISTLAFLLQYSASATIAYQVSNGFSFNILPPSAYSVSNASILMFHHIGPWDIDMNLQWLPHSDLIGIG